jgi:antitoxin (DNA-binding transcriptional repressor) of toxin-antitoxin stability system
MLSSAEKGEKIIITKRGKKVAMLIPIEAEIQNDCSSRSNRIDEDIAKGYQARKETND